MATWKKIAISGSDISQFNNDSGYLISGDSGIELSGSFSGSFEGTFVGTTDLPDLTDGNGIVDFTYDGSTTATIAVQADSTTGGNIVPVNVSTNGVGLDVDSIDGVGLTANSGVLDVDYGSTSGTAVEGDTTITINGTTNAIDITGVASQALGGAPSYTIDLSDTISGNRIFTGDVLINGDLTVEGTASFQNTTNLEVADRFILLASGSSTSGDGGIVIQQATQDVGEIFGWDDSTDRWAVTSSFNASQNNFTPDAYMAAAIIGSGIDPEGAGSPNARYSAAGNLYIGTDESIWIYS